MPRNSILVIDDSRTRNLVIRHFLENSFEVFTAFDGKTGVEIFKSHQPDIILLDINLPDCNGFELCKLIKSEKFKTNTAVILMSASHSPPDIAFGFLVGCDDFLTIPLLKSNLISRIQFILSLHKGIESD